MSRTRALALPAAGLALLAAAPATAQQKRVVVAPYIELDQVLTDDLVTGDVLTYTELAAGIDASVSTARAEGQVSYRYEHRFAESDHLGDDDIHTGLARGSYKLTRSLSLDGGAIATRTRADIRGAAPGVLGGDYSNIAQVYSFYVGPTLSTSAGPVAIGADYRYGYTHAEAPHVTGLPAGDRDYFDSSHAHVVEASASVAPGQVAPIGLTVSGAIDQERAGQLDQHYIDKYARADALAPVGRTLAVTVGIGAERIKISQLDPLVAADGTVVTDRDGRFVTDPNSPRRVAYRTDGLIYDAGVIWRPSPRTALSATVAHRYGGTSYTGALSWQARRDVSVNAVVYDGIETFGHQLRTGLQNLPTSFLTQRDSFGQQFNGCIFGANPGSGAGGTGGAGGCLSNVFQSLAATSYRARGIDAVAVASHGADSFGVGGGYANRHLYSPDDAPGITLIGLDDESWYLQGFWERRITRVSGVDANLFANWYDTDQPGFGTVFGAGGTGSYYHYFGRVGTIAQLGVYTYHQNGFDDAWSAQALVGARYQF